MNWNDFADMLAREANDICNGDVKMALYNIAGNIKRRLKQEEDEEEKLRCDLDQLLDPNS